ncbi:MAG TPA: cytochrome c1 [Hyphomonas sp.]|nr:cytochrome c1 [Hyphomonas sp.]HRJ01000.1 cytochrome c1 [Hyphomonas sp.]HRK66885.1 cytochrome c1 [Hyphomonas sp.]
MKTFRILAAGLTALAFTGLAHAAGGAKHADGPEAGWPFEGITGKYDQASVQRGYQVYKEVCSSCHGMKLLSYRNLGEKGGPFYDPAYPNPNDNPFVKALAAQNEIVSPTPNDVGEFELRPATPADRFRSPFANDAAARAANGGALPPDLSVITKARHGGASYVYNLLTGYPDFSLYEDRVSEVDGETVYETVIDMSKFDKLGKYKPEQTSYLLQPAGQYYNPYMPGDTRPNYGGDPRHAPPGGFLAMGPQLTDGRVEYSDGTEATISQMAYDVAQFLAWAGDPKMQARKEVGLATMVYLGLLAILLWFSYKRIWRKVEH